MALLYGRAGRLAAKNGGFRPRWAVAIDDQDEGNAAMKMVSGSHRLGQLEWHDTQADLDDRAGLARSSWLWQQIDDAEQYGEVCTAWGDTRILHCR